jgi:Tfp pilus assembly protein PilX
MKIVILSPKLNNEKGVALILAIMLMLALAVLTISAFELLISSVRITKNIKDDFQALYVSEAGIEDAILQLRYNGNWNTGFTDKNFGGNNYDVTITTVSMVNGHQFMVDIQSTGKVGYFQRILKARVKIIETPEFPSLPYSVAVMYWTEKEV